MRRRARGPEEEAQQAVHKRRPAGAARAAGPALAGEKVPSRGAAVDPAKAARVAQLVAAIGSTAAEAEPGRALQALGELRKLLSTELRPPIQALIEAGGLRPLVARLTDASPAVQLEAAWALTNAASGSSVETLAIVEAGALEALFNVLGSPNISDRADLCDQCLWAVGNLAGDGDVSLRDRVLGSGVVGHLGQLYESLPTFAWDLRGRMQVLRTLTWLMGSLCRGQPAPPLTELDCAFDYFVQVLLGLEDVQMLSEALWGLCFLLEGAAGEEEGCTRAARMLSAGFAPGEAPQTPAAHPLLTKVARCAQGAGEPRNPLPAPALRLLGTLVGLPGESLTDAAIAAGALTTFRSVLLDSQAPAELRGVAALALANVAAGTPTQAQRLAEAPGVWNAICKTLEKGPSREVRRECAWCVANVTRRGSQALQRLEGRKLLPLLATALRGEADAALQRALLESCEAVLRYRDEQAASKVLGRNALVVTAEDCGLQRELETLQRSQQEGVQWKAARIIKHWFSGSADRENEPPEDKTPKKDRTVSVCTPSAICGGSPIRPAAYKFGA